MNEIIIQDVKNILRDKVKQTIKHINHYDTDTNKYDEDELKERIVQSREKEEILKERLKTNYKVTISQIEKEIDRILNSHSKNVCFYSTHYNNRLLWKYVKTNLKKDECLQGFTKKCPLLPVYGGFVQSGHYLVYHFLLHDDTP